MRAVVTGGSGGLGSVVVDLLRERGVSTVAASRRTGVDLQTGAGLDQALRGADVIVHAATHPLKHRRVDLNGTQRLIDVVARHGGATHIVYISIVGCSQMPLRFYRIKTECEHALERSGLPATVVRATQFHPLVAKLARLLGSGPIAIVPPLTFQPCDPRWVAARLTELAVAASPVGFERVPDLAGPEVVTMRDAITLTRGGVRRALRMPAVGGVLRAYAAGGNLPGPDAEIGGMGYREWLAE